MLVSEGITVRHPAVIAQAFRAVYVRGMRFNDLVEKLLQHVDVRRRVVPADAQKVSAVRLDVKGSNLTDRPAIATDIILPADAPVQEI